MRPSRHATALLVPSLLLSLWFTGLAHADVATCTTDASCGQDERCEVTGASTGGCRDGMCDPGTSVEIKSCVPRVRTCTTDSECPSPTVCADAGDGTVSSDGQRETRSEGTKVCTWRPKACTTDSQCGDPLYGCLEVGREETCTAPDENTDAPVPTEAADPSGPGTPDSNDEPSLGVRAPDAPTECTVTAVIKACLPKPVACSTNAQCSGGWTCVASDGFDEGPYDREASAGYCMPEGIRLATSGHVRIDSNAFGNPTRAGSDEGGVGSRPTSADLDKASDDGSEKNACGCSYGGPRSHATASFALLALVAALVGRRSLRHKR